MKKYWYFCFTVTDNSGEKVFRQGSSVMEGKKGKKLFSVSGSINQIFDYLVNTAWFETLENQSTVNYDIHITNHIEITEDDFDVLKGQVCY